MSETATSADRDQRGRFLTGGRPGPGRARGSRNKLSENFVSDLAACWELHGASALEKCAKEQPDVLIKVIASILPRNVNLSLEIDAAGFASRFAQARALLGIPDAPQQHRSLRGKLLEIEHDG